MTFREIATQLGEAIIGTYKPIFRLEVLSGFEENGPEMRFASS